MKLLVIYQSICYTIHGVLGVVKSRKRTRDCLKIEELPNFLQTAGERKAKKAGILRIPGLFNAASAPVCRKRREF
ncbi:hypothetical protein D3Z39_08015 [Anaerotruncus colihominis]|uniref:Uncharacterized protein n=1 Tax=Anaerotruncus colihominis TaxID=169435 RepID=A0A845RGA6_9FIRM|nr:hypothetical protein [Anaerotruncus colihominis]NDO39381.1 hypothetical protein [Anaerotruncus colihominis]